MKDENTILKFLFFNFIYLKSEIIKIEFSYCNLTMTDKHLTNGENKILMTIEDEKNTVCEYDYNNNKINGNFQNPEVIVTIPIFLQLYKYYMYISDNLEVDPIKIYKYNIFNVLIKLNESILISETITIENQINNLENTISTIISKFQVLYKNNENIIKEDKIEIIYKSKRDSNPNISIIFNNLSSYLKPSYIYNFIDECNKEYNEQIKNNNTENTNKKINIPYINLNNQKINKPDITDYILEIKEFKTSLSLENNKKISEISIQNFNITFGINSNNDSDILKYYTVQIQKIDLKYFDKQNNKINILTNIPGDNDQNNNNEFQIRIIGGNDTISIDFFSLQILLRIDSFLSLFLYIKNSLPIYSDNSKNNNNKKKILPQIQFKLINSKYILETSFDRTEYMILSMDEFYIIFNSNNGLELPYGNYTIKINSIIAEFVNRNKKRELFHTKNDFLTFNSIISKDLISIKYRIQSIIISLSYSDIVSLLKSYQLNMFYHKYIK